MRRGLILAVCCMLCGGMAGWLTIRSMLRGLYERVAYFERKVDRQEQDILMLRRSLLSEKRSQGA
jgi:hypothetical protein